MAVAFSPDGKQILTGSSDAASGKPLGEPFQHTDAVLALAFSPDGHRVVTASLDGTARIWDAATGKAIGEPMKTTPVRGYRRLHL